MSRGAPGLELSHWTVGDRRTPADGFPVAVGPRAPLDCTLP